MSLRSLVFLLLLLILPPKTWAQVSRHFLSQSQPQYELGVGTIMINTPNYPGAKHTLLRAVPFPYYIYRGKYLRSDDEGTRARLLAAKKYETGLSFSYNFPVHSEDNPARKGMPDLDGIIAVGPRFLYRFLTHTGHQRLNLSIAARAVFSSKFSFTNLLKAQGYLMEPRVGYWYRWTKSQTTFYSSLGLEFGSAKYNQYFYNVSDSDVTALRSRYHARSGLVQIYTSIGLGQRITPRLFTFLGASYRNLQAAANNASPLVESKENMAFIFGLVWTFFESEAQVQPLTPIQNP